MDSLNNKKTSKTHIKKDDLLKIKKLIGKEVDERENIKNTFKEFFIQMLGQRFFRGVLTKNNRDIEIWLEKELEKLICNYEDKFHERFEKIKPYFKYHCKNKYLYDLNLGEPVKNIRSGEAIQYECGCIGILFDNTTTIFNEETGFGNYANDVRYIFQCNKHKWASEKIIYGTPRGD